MSAAIAVAAVVVVAVTTVDFDVVVTAVSTATAAIAAGNVAATTAISNGASLSPRNKALAMPCLPAQVDSLSGNPVVLDKLLLADLAPYS